MDISHTFCVVYTLDTGHFLAPSKFKIIFCTLAHRSRGVSVIARSPVGEAVDTDLTLHCLSLILISNMEGIIHQNSESDTTETIENLKGRLARRNDLLDIIRKAYHRDVLSIKQYLLEAEKEGLLVNKSALSSLPSIDFREGFHLFAPHECELRVRPCESCGGQLEIIHRESSRIVQYKHAIQQMEENEIDLRIEVIDAKSQAKKDRDRLVAEMQRSQNERDVLGNQMEHLKSQLSNCNAEIERLQEDKAHLEHTVEQQHPIMSDHQRLVVELQKEREESRRLEANFLEQKEKANGLQQKLSSAVEQLRNQTSQNEQLQLDLQQERLRCNMFEDLASKLKKDLSASQSKEKEHFACLQQSEGTIDELKSILAHDRDKMSSEIQDLTDKNKKLTARVNELDELSRCKCSEADYYCLRIKGIVEEARDRGSISLVPNTVEDQLSTTEEIIRDHETLRQETRALSRLLTSCIRTVYESCIVQEKMLRANDSGLHRNVQIKVQADTPNEAWQVVMRNLEHTAEAEAIDWQSIINDDEDRTFVFSSLHNRQQVGQFSLDRAFEKERKRHDRILIKCQYEHEKEATELQRKIKELEQQFTDSASLIRKYEQKMIILQQKHALGVIPLLTSAQDLLLQVRKEVQQEEENTFNKLREDFFHLRGVTINLLDTLRVLREKIAQLNTTLRSRDDDISARDAAIVHFEEMLTKITHKYAENERRRVKMTRETSVQASVKVKEASTFDDFLRLPLDKRSQQHEENNPPQQHDHALLPGRIFQIRENIGKIQFRRALDKL